jgi:sensor histidine kinase YesM
LNIVTFQLDFYINAINHGGLLEKEGAFIKTSVWKEEGFLYLEIEDNGIALSKDGLPNSRISTGHDRVSKRFELFNRQNSNIKLSFDKTKDFRKLFDKKGNPCGAKAIIKIAYNDKS